MLRLVFNPQGDVREAARGCEADVFAARYGNSAALLEEEYGPYDAASVFVVVADDQDDVVASARIILPNPAGLKTLVDLGRPPWEVDGSASAAAAGLDLSSTWDIATIANRGGSWGPGVHPGTALWFGIFMAPRVNDIKTLVAVLDNRVRRLVATMGMLVQTLPNTSTAPYLGSTASAPIYTHVTAMLAGQRHRNLDAHRRIALGIGLSGISTPELSSFLLDAAAAPQKSTPAELRRSASLPDIDLRASDRDDLTALLPGRLPSA
jgi:hypothetical protein